METNNDYKMYSFSGFVWTEERGFVNTMNFGLVKTLAVYLCLVEFSDLPCKSVMTFCGHVNRRSIGSFRAGENCTDK